MVDDVLSSPVSGRTSEELETHRLKRELLVSLVFDVKALGKDVFLSEYNNVFTGLWYVKGYKIERLEGAVPRQNAP